MMNNKIIAFDVDGVLLDLNSAWKNQAESILGRELHLQQNCFEFTLRYGVTSEEEKHVWKNIVFTNFPAYPSASEITHALKNKGFDVHAITALNASNKESRKNNLESHAIHCDALHCVGFNQSKVAALQNIRPSIFVDDREKYILEAIEVGIPHVIYLSHDYEDQKTTVMPDSVTIVSGLKDIVQFARQL